MAREDVHAKVNRCFDKLKADNDGPILVSSDAILRCAVEKGGLNEENDLDRSSREY